MKYKLKDVCNFYAGTGFPVAYQGNNEGELPFYKVGDISSNVAKGYTVLQECNNYISREEAAELRGTIVPPGTVVFAKIGEALKLNRRALTACDCLIDNNTMGICPGRLVNSEYFYYFMLQLKMETLAESTTVPSVRKSRLEQVEIEMPALSEQIQIVTVLNGISKIILSRKRQLIGLDNLVKARFVEMLGDTVLNPFELPSATLEGMADIVSGITKGRKTKEQNLIEVPYMSVSNVKNGYIDWTTVKTILATEAEVRQYRLLPDDVLMTEGGDPDKLGRGAIIRKPLENCIHQNHIFRVRLNESLLLPTYFAEYLQHPKAKQYFLGCAKQTTGIASINMGQLRKLPVLVPPIDKQNDFNLFVMQVDKSKVVVQKALDEAQTLFGSLMQKYFN